MQWVKSHIEEVMFCLFLLVLTGWLFYELKGC